jgi:hypothetical protein
MANKVKYRMDKREPLTLRQDMELLKIYNSTFLTSIACDRRHARFIKNYRKEFNEYYFKILVNKYELGIGKGFSMYLKKLDMYVEVAAPLRCRDLYLIY